MNATECNIKPIYQPTFSEKVKVWFANLPSTPQRFMANYLRKKGWVCFYLEKQYRKCDSKCCWMDLAEQEQERTVEPNLGKMMNKVKQLWQR